MKWAKWILLINLLVVSGSQAEDSTAVDVQVTALFRGKALLTIDNQPKILANGESHRGVTLLSADSRGAEIRHQGTIRTLTLNQRIGGGYHARSQATLQIWPDSRGMYRTTGTINGFAVMFLVDTGASSIAMNSQQAQRMGIDYRLRGEPRRVSTASAVVPAYGLTLKQVTVGELAFNQIDAVVIEGNQPTEILLGMSYLNRLEISHRNGAMVLKQKY